MEHANPLDEAAIANVRREVASLAQALISRGLPFLEGVRKLASMRFEVPGEQESPEFLLFAGIASEADHIPSESARRLCAESWLIACDREAKELQELYEEHVAVACASLAERFRGAA